MNRWFVQTSLVPGAGTYRFLLWGDNKVIHDMRVSAVNVGEAFAHVRDRIAAEQLYVTQVQHGLGFYAP